MADKSTIEWTDATWNPVTGCTKISPGCAYCYAEGITLRFKRGGPYLPGKTTINLHYDRLDSPGKWKAPRRIFVNSMSDLFHDEVPFDFVGKVEKGRQQGGHPRKFGCHFGTIFHKKCDQKSMQKSVPTKT